MGIKVNFSRDEAEFTPKEVPPTGEHLCRIANVEERLVKPGSTNAGKPYWSVRFVVDEGKYSGSSIFTNVMLFEGKDGTLKTLSMFLKALGYDITAGEFDLPEPEQLMGEAIIVKGTKYLAGSKDRNGRERTNDRFEPYMFKSPQLPRKEAKSSLLP